ncbi:MAG: putative bifunctional diguanylate cyclase/phosphodiesterase [Sphingomicrobium sp.]
MLGVEQPFLAGEKSARLLTARRELIVLSVLITAVMLLVWNGSSFFHHVRIGGQTFGPDVRIAATTLTLNVALILFGWRRYVDLQHESEKRIEGEHRAAILASTDQVTGLNNRKGFADGAEALRVAARERGDYMVLLSVQIHRFKVVSDQHGYDTGDRLLKCLAAALVEELGPDAVIARLSGDEFAAAIALDSSELQRVEELADAALRGITRPFTIEDRVLQVGAFAGLASAKAAEASVPDLLRRADIALNHAKNGRVARPVWFDAGMERALVAQGEIEQGIRFGLEHGQFLPYFEPQVDLSTGEIVGFEVLARWNHPSSGIIGADVFIPVAEDIGVIGRLSEQVIAEALREAASWDPLIKISVNISPSQFADGWLAHRIVRTLTETGFPPDRLVVEITESSLFADMDLARSMVTSLKNQGVLLALDDFGTGFSSLSSLRSLPFDLIKIDRSFVTNVHDHKENMAIIRAVATLASALSVPVCVEGIESEAVHETVVALGCGIGQGWYFGKPMPAEKAREMLASRKSATTLSPPRSLPNASTA